MIFLILAVLCSSTMSIVIRLSNGRVKSRISMLAANYLTCMVTAVCFLGPRNLFASAEGFSRAFGMGMLNGIFFMTALIANQYSISRIGMVLPSVFSRMGGLLVPLVFSIFLFGEVPGALQIVGAMLAVAGILLMNLKSGSGKAGCTAALIILLLTEGMASSMTKIYRETGVAAFSDNFLFFTFTSAFILCAAVAILRHERPGLREVLFGAMIGVPNFLATRFILGALENIPAIIVYPSRSVGTIAVIALTGVLVFKEKLSKRQVIALMIIIAALILLNL